jgi:LacI family transcriptional regulator
VNKSSILEVAKLAGVSPSTVSRVTNNKAIVKEATRIKVEAAMQKLGYTPNSAAQSLSSKRTNTIGMVVAMLDGPFYGPMISGVESALRNKGKHLLIASGSGSAEGEEEAVEFLLNRQVDGLILLTDWLDKRYLKELEKRVPFYMINQHHDTLSHRVMWLDDVEGAYSATKYLISKGHTKIACISGQEFKTDANDRVLGYKKALKEANIPVIDDLIVRTSFEVSGGLNGMDQLKENNVDFTAVFAGNDESAIGILTWANEHNISVPDQLSVIGFDDILISQHVTPPLTTMRAPNFEMAKTCADMAFNEIYRKAEPSGGKFVTTLIERKSVKAI